MVVSSQVQVILAKFLILFTLSFSPIHMFLIRGMHMRLVIGFKLCPIILFGF